MRFTVDGRVDGRLTVAKRVFAQVRGQRLTVDGNFSTFMWVCALIRTLGTWGPVRKQLSTASTVNLGEEHITAMKHRIVGGSALVNGQRHTMRIARPASVTARLYGLNPNHHVRVWCTCLDARRTHYEDGRRRMPVKSERQLIDVEAVEEAGVIPSFLDDPRSLGDFDWLGIADVRVPGSALALFRRHLEEVERESRLDPMP